ncbi:hypothetical protein ABRY23_06025 [Melioribacteraceae bacterium 4301-Me]|uniref:hypothetical protein n=1 Tax=Pyranulibacter aquaticus TaxID=3163344 RepID=UPI003596C64A
MEASFLPPKHLTGFGSDKLIGYYAIDKKLSIKILSSLGKEEASFGVFPSEYKNFIYRFEAGGLVVDKYKNIYQMNVSSPEIYKYNKEGKLIKIFDNYSKRFRYLQKDLSDDPISIINETKNLKDISLAERLFLLNEKTLLIKLRHKNNFGILLLNLEGKLLHEHEFELKDNLVCAKNNYLIFIKNQQVAKDSIYVNPILIIYKLK